MKNSMMLNEAVVWIIIAVFIAGFLVNIFGPKPVREEFTRWGLPQWLRIFAGIAEGVIAVLLIAKLYILTALVIASFVMSAAVLIVLYNQEIRRALIPFSVLVVILISISQHV